MHGNRNDECVIFVLLIRSAKGRPIYFVKKGVEGRATNSEPNFKSQKGKKKNHEGKYKRQVNDRRVSERAMRHDKYALQKISQK